MRNPFVQKRCRQCGWELGFFNQRDFCSDACVSTWDRNEREQEEYKKEKTRNELAAIREMKDYQRYVAFKEEFEEKENPLMAKNNLEKLEGELLDMTVDIWNTFMALEQSHPSDINDMADTVHSIQKIIAMRHMRKIMPETFTDKR